MSAAINFDPASFKDPLGRVRVFDDHIERSFAPSAAVFLQAFFNSALYNRLSIENQIIPGVFEPEHSRVTQPLVNFWNYPFEWSFAMLRDAALLTLTIQENSLAEGYSLKDASAYNIVFEGLNPRFIDIFSFEKMPSSIRWGGYDQFCREFFNPLALSAARKLPFQSIYRGYLNGIPTQDLAALLPAWKMFKRGHLLHVFLKSRLDQKLGGVKSTNPEPKGLTTDIARDILLKLCRSLRQALTSLRAYNVSEWSDYTKTRSYSDTTVQQKRSFVQKFAEADAAQSLTDYGCNTGEFSELCSPHYKQIVSVDSDALCIDRFYVRLKSSHLRNITPLVQDLANPSSALGWNSQERRNYTNRCQTESFLALALIHHLRVTASIPTVEILNYFKRYHQQGIIEYVSPSDPMTSLLLQNRRGFDCSDYQPEAFDKLLRENFAINAELQLTATRKLYAVRG